MIDWNEFKDAVRVAIRYYDDNDRLLGQTIATRHTQTKTVADAVEYLKQTSNGEWHSEYNYLNYTDSEGWYYSDTDSFAGLVCTHEQFEAYVAGVVQVDLDIDIDKMKSQYNKEQEGEKWTHVYCGEKCKVVGEPDSFGRVVILTESNTYFLDKPESLKPIKPTISKAEAWDKLLNDSKYHKNYNLTLQMLNESYDII